MDAPTYNQVELMYRWMVWCMPTAEAHDAARWVEKNKSKQEVSREISRLHDLKDKHALTRESCFAGKFWEGYFKR